MNAKRALDRMMKRLGNRTAPGLRADCLEELYLAQQKLEDAPELPWFIQSENVTTTVTPGERRVLLPPDFIREVEDFNLELSTDEGETFGDLTRKNYDEIHVEISRNADQAEPQFYYVRGDYIILHPIPDQAYYIRFPTYYARQEEPLDDESSENSWFKHVPGLLLGMAGLVICTAQLKDPDLVPFFQAEKTEGENLLVRLITAKEEEGRSRRMG